MAEIKEIFSGDPETVVMSMDFQEVATGTAYITYYFQDLVGAGVKKILGENIIYSHAGFLASTDLDFDLDFEVPFSIEGVATINMVYSLAGSANIDVFADLYHVDKNNNETHIGTQAVGIVGPNNNSQVAAFYYDIPLTTFKAEETLRVNMTSTQSVTYLFDPKDRTAELIAQGCPGVITQSQSVINLPVRI